LQRLGEIMANAQRSPHLPFRNFLENSRFLFTANPLRRGRNSGGPMARDYSEDFQKILEQISLADVRGTETPANDLLDLNMSDSKGRRFNAAHLRGALRAGETSGYGSLIVGRRGYPTRFAWSKVPAAVTKAPAPAAKAPAAKAPVAVAPPAPEPAPVETAPVAVQAAPAAPAPAPASKGDGVVHTLQLRANLAVHFELPADLTPREAERLAHWVQALTFA
jgi:hypothetical protein